MVQGKKTWLIYMSNMCEVSWSWQSLLGKVPLHNRNALKKTALHIILGGKYESYDQALKSTGLQNLELRRQNLCLKFALKAESHQKHKRWFKLNTNQVNTRQCKTKYKTVQFKHSRFRNSPISYLTNLLNTHYSRTQK